MPDAATLEVMAWWGGSFALIALGGWTIARIVDQTSPFAPSRNELPVGIPGFERPSEQEERWRTPGAALRLTVFVAFVGAMIGWSTTGEPDSHFDSKLQLFFELAAVAVAWFVLMRTLRDIPVVGEAPPDDPELARPVRLRNAAWKLAAAAFMLGVVWLTLD